MNIVTKKKGRILETYADNYIKNKGSEGVLNRTSQQKFFIEFRKFDHLQFNSIEIIFEIIPP